MLVVFPLLNQKEKLQLNHQRQNDRLYNDLQKALKLLILPELSVNMKKMNGILKEIVMIGSQR